MKKVQSGFTLIELVMVIVILGVLSAVAIPKFTDLSADAKKAAVAGVAGNLSSASAVNYASRSVNATYGVPIGTTNTTCTAAAGVLLQGGVPTVGGATAVITPTTTLATAIGTTTTCTLTYTINLVAYAANFTVVSIP